MAKIGVTARAGNQVEGLELDEQLTDMLFGHLSEPQQAEKVIIMMKIVLSFAVSFDQGMDLISAANWVNAHSTEIH